MKAAQQTIACRIIAQFVDATREADVGDLPHAVPEISKISPGDAAKPYAQLATLWGEFASDDQITEAVVFLSLNNPECPERFARIFSKGRGA